MEGGEIIIKAFRSCENGMILGLMRWQTQSKALPENHWCAAVTQSQCNGKGAPGNTSGPISPLVELQCPMNPGTYWTADLEKFKQSNLHGKWKIPEEKIVIKKKLIIFEKPR